MATRKQAIQALRPKIVQQETVDIEELVDWIVKRGVVTREQCLAVLELIDQKMIHAKLHGEVLEIPGLGTYRPQDPRDGSREESFEVDPALDAKLKAPSAFTGEIINEENTGLSEDELVEKWNELHPDDPVEEEPGTEDA